MEIIKTIDGMVSRASEGRRFEETQNRGLLGQENLFLYNTIIVD